MHYKGGVTSPNGLCTRAEAEPSPEWRHSGSPLRDVALSLSSWLPEHLPINQHCVFHKPGQSTGLEEQRDVKDHVVVACGNGNIPPKREQC